MNVTIDDASPDISYFPTASWNDQACTPCTAKPPVTSSIENSTWHDATHEATDPPWTATLTFNGTGVYVFGITIDANSVDPSIKNQDLSFYIDDQLSGSFVYDPRSDNATSYRYRVPFFSKSNLSSGIHTLRISVEGTSLCLLDYIMYTKDFEISSASPPTSSSNSLTPTAPPSQDSSALSGSNNLAISIALPIILVFLLFISSILIIMFLRQRRMRREKEMETYQVTTPVIPPFSIVPASSISAHLLQSQRQTQVQPGPSINPPTELLRQEVYQSDHVIVQQREEEEQGLTLLQQPKPESGRRDRVEDRPPPAYTPTAQD